MNKKFEKLKKEIKSDLTENSKFYISISVLLATVVVLFGFVFINCFVPSESMLPTLEPNQLYIADRLAYTKSPPKRGDIVVFKAPDEEHAKYVKRIIGLPGELVCTKNNAVTIDGKTLDEPYLNEEMEDDTSSYYVPKKGDEVTLKNIQRNHKDEIIYANCYIGDYYVGNFGAPQENGTGLIMNKKINFLKKYCKEENGKYIIKEDTYFMMGDNRNNSLDARYWDYAYVKKSKIVAKYMFTYLSFHRNN